MIFIFYFLLNLFPLIFFFKFQKKHLHSLEIFVLWLVSSMLFQNYSALFFMNFKYFIIPNVFSIEMTHFMNRIVLIPIITLIFLNRYIVTKPFYQRMVLTFFFIFLLTVIETLADFLGVLKHTHWRIWWSIEFWVIYILLLILIMGIFRKTLLKEVGRA
jgi:hypothetical protein